MDFALIYSCGKNLPDFAIFTYLMINLKTKSNETV